MRTPRIEYDKQRDGEPHYLAQELHSAHEVGPSVVLVQVGEDRVVDGLDGARYEEAAGIAKFWQMFLMFEQMLDLDRRIVCEVWKLAMQRAHDLHRVPDAVEEIGVAERY